MKVIKKLLFFFDCLINIMVFFAGLLLIFLTIGVSVSVATRYFFNYPMSWITEISSYTLLYMTFLVAAWVLGKEGHVSMDFVIGALSRRGQCILNFTTSVLSSIICLVMSWYGLKVSWDLFINRYFTSTFLELPKCIFTAVIFLGFFVLSIQFLRRGCAFLEVLKTSRLGT